MSRAFQLSIKTTVDIHEQSIVFFDDGSLAFDCKVSTSNLNL